ncbi:MAG: hypothetical protein LBR31_01560 [Desulfovibrio sp.]|jgi:hypothetical protein|nr:hypothetical protein [Desulfovibrio sp.]
MSASWGGIYFDKQDSDILALVNRMLEVRANQADISLFDPGLHPHGIKELVASPVSRIAYAVINLLRNLEAGSVQARDRLLALESLYDEVLNSAHSELRRNTARVLVQIMKSIVRAHGKRENQIRLVHDFRRAVQGTPRVVRELLARYYLPEMPEEWNQLAFDDHVYDANTRGRKTPTHLIMDAWIKGLRSLTVAYEYCVSTDVASELLRAAEITGITLRVGIEYHIPFYDKNVSLFWIPRGFSGNEDFLEFLHDPNVVRLMEKGSDVLVWRKARTLESLHVWNRGKRLELEQTWGVPVPELDDETFLNFVGRGQPTTLHLAECLHQHILPAASERAKILAGLPDDERRGASQELGELENLGPEQIIEDWLSPAGCPETRHAQATVEQMPELLRHTPKTLISELLACNPGYRLVLGTMGLTAEDVTELLWDSEGAISHLEIFNMKGWMEGRHEHITAIGELQLALNAGHGPRIKQMVRQMWRDMLAAGDELRAKKFRSILRSVPQLWGYYRHHPLGTRLGTSSVSRLTFGMGLVITDTLPRRAVADLHRRHRQQPKKPIPIHAPVEECMIYRQSRNPNFWQRLVAPLRRLPGCRHLGMRHRREWKTASEKYRVCEQGNVVNLGGLSQRGTNNLLGNSHETALPHPGPTYLNSSISNFLKVLVGFIPAFGSFLYTQNWWFLAWFGVVIWFAITGVRNVVQMVLAAQGATRGTLVHWKDQVNVGRLCDSLMYTGISVFLLEVLVRVVLLERVCGVTVETSPLTVFAVLNVVNGVYICAHNVYRGFPRQAAIGNLFRSVLAIPVASLYNTVAYEIFFLIGVQDVAFYLVPSAAVISKMASDTVAAIIEGFADSQVNLRMRRWDYRRKFEQIFECYTNLELLFPHEDALVRLGRVGGLKGQNIEKAKALERSFIVHALDLMYIWFYQPRAQHAMRQILRTLPAVDKLTLLRTQLVLMREHEISQMLVDGLLGRNFSRPLAFYLENRTVYLRRLSKLCRMTAGAYGAR